MVLFVYQHPLQHYIRELGNQDRRGVSIAPLLEGGHTIIPRTHILGMQGQVLLRLELPAVLAGQSCAISSGISVLRISLIIKGLGYEQLHNLICNLVG